MGFIEKFEDVIPPQVKFILKNGKTVEGGFDKIEKLLFDLEDFCRLISLSLLDTLLFTYYGDVVFDVSAFSGSGVEKVIRDDRLLLNIHK